MKKLLSLLLAIMMLLGVAFSFAEEETGGYEDEDSGWTAVDLYDKDGNYIGFEEYNPDGKLSYRRIFDDPEGKSFTSTFFTSDGAVGSYEKYTSSDDGSYSSVSYDSKDQVTSRTTGKSEGDSFSNSTVYFKNGETSWINTWGEDENGYYDVSFNPDGSIYANSPWGNSMPTATYNTETGKWIDNETGKVVDAPIALATLFKEAKSKILRDPVWYYHNTVSIAGISLRDEYPDLTQKWYNVVPVDLSKDGSQSFPLVASNMYYVGSVTVTVNGDEVTTKYKYPVRGNYKFSAHDECLAWFTGVDQITADFLENPTSNMAFGKAVSKANDLNGQDIALLFVCNHVTYRIPFTDDGIMPAKFWRSGKPEYFNSLNELMKKIGQ